MRTLVALHSHTACVNCPCPLTHYDSESRNRMPADIREVRYHCCDHCGSNFPEWLGSYCNTDPNNHAVPCNEPGCEIGQEVYLGFETVSQKA